MNIRFENQSSRARLPRSTVKNIESIINSLPKEHLRGVGNLRLVDSIRDPRARSSGIRSDSLPGLYHPKQGPKPAWIEVAIDALLPNNVPIHKRLIPRLSFKANLATVIFSLVGQHHFLTLRHSVKKGQIESSIRLYTERQLRRWNEGEHGLRTRLFKPVQPVFEKWARALQRRAKKERKKA
ncbi:MAG TPA: hypothetical protein VLJ61_05365 [Pyrinomonadaceae bacterium]|nr:hypothetical protein [Pyrinomonadaceae bacterium]